MVSVVWLSFRTGSSPPMLKLRLAGTVSAIWVNAVMLSTEACDLMYCASALKAHRSFGVYFRLKL